MMKSRYRPIAVGAGLLALGLASGCASTKVTNNQNLVTGAIPRPSQIWVYDFAATPADVQAQSALAGQSSDAPPLTDQQIAEGRKLGAQIAADLVQQVNALGIPTANASAATRPRINDLVIEGALLSVQEGSAGGRIIVGFGVGGSELKVAVEVFQMGPTGLHRLASGDLNATGNKTPGTAVGLATFLATNNPAGLILSAGMKVYGQESGRATVEGRAAQIAKDLTGRLKAQFEKQGWIQP
jgi:hypothetical protein